MIEEQARVVAVEGDLAWVETQRRSACGACGARSGCGSGVLAKVLGRRMSMVAAINQAGAQPGDQVIVGIAEQSLLRGSLAVYTVPLLAMFGGALGGEVLLPAWGDMGAVVSGILGLGAGFLWLRRFAARIVRDPRYQPVVLRRLSAVTGRVPGILPV